MPSARLRSGLASGCQSLSFLAEQILVLDSMKIAAILTTAVELILVLCKLTSKFNRAIK